MDSEYQKCEYCDERGHGFMNCKILNYDVKHGILYADRVAEERARDEQSKLEKCEYCNQHGHGYINCKILNYDVDHGILYADRVAEERIRDKKNKLKICDYCDQKGHKFINCQILNYDIEHGILYADKIAEERVHEEKINIENSCYYKKGNMQYYLKEQNSSQRPATSKRSNIHTDKKENNYNSVPKRICTQHPTDSRNFELNDSHHSCERDMVQMFEKKNDSRLNDVSNIRFLRIRHDLPIIKLKSSDLTKDTTEFSIDENAEISIIKISSIDPKVFIDKKITYKFAGVTRGECGTLGKIVIDLDGLSFELHVVPDSFPIETDGLIGRDAIAKQGGQQSATLKGSKLPQFPIQKESLMIPANIRRTLDAMNTKNEPDTANNILIENSDIFRENLELTNDKDDSIEKTQVNTSTQHLALLHYNSACKIKKQNDCIVKIYQNNVIKTGKDDIEEDNVGQGTAIAILANKEKRQENLEKPEKYVKHMKTPRSMLVISPIAEPLQADGQLRLREAHIDVLDKFIVAKIRPPEKPPWQQTLQLNRMTN